MKEIISTTTHYQVTAAREALATLKPQAALAAQQPVAPAPPPVNVAAPEPARPEPMEVETQLVPIGESLSQIQSLSDTIRYFQIQVVIFQVYRVDIVGSFIHLRN